MAVNRLMDYVKSASLHQEFPPVMPLMHSCSGLSGRAILTSNTLRTSYCRSFHEDLLYFFYGKPSYPAGAKYTLHHPVCFLIDTNAVIMNKVHPFDSGAFFYGLYREHLSPFANIQDYSLDENLITIQQYILAIYGNNTNYIQGVAKPELQSEIALADFFQLITDPNIPRNLLDIRENVRTSKVDGRSRTIEVVTKSNIYLTDALLCVILPDTLLRDRDIIQFLNLHSIEYITYSEDYDLAPSEYDRIVFQLVENYLIQHHMIFTTI